MDSRLRILERSAQVGDPEAETRLLLERLRQGEVSRPSLELAAYLGHGPARAALGAEAPALADPSPLQLTLGLSRWPQEVSVRAIVAATRHVLAHHDIPDEDEVPEARDAVEAAAAWLEDPCEANREAAASRAQAAELRGTRLSRAGYYAARAAAARALDWADAPQWRDAPPEQVVAHLASTLAGHGMFMCSGLVEVPAEATWVARRASRAAAIRGVVQRALVPWALA